MGGISRKVGISLVLPEDRWYNCVSNITGNISYLGPFKSSEIVWGGVWRTIL